MKNKKNKIDIHSFTAGFVLAGMLFMIPVLFGQNTGGMAGSVGNYGYGDYYGYSSYFSSSSDDYYGYSSYFSSTSSSGLTDCNGDGIPDDRCDYVCWTDMNSDGILDDPC